MVVLEMEQPKHSTAPEAQQFFSVELLHLPQLVEVLQLMHQTMQRNKESLVGAVKGVKMVNGNEISRKTRVTTTLLLAPSIKSNI